jgi:hypothetical protein
VFGAVEAPGILPKRSGGYDALNKGEFEFLEKNGAAHQSVEVFRHENIPDCGPAPGDDTPCGGICKLAARL